MRRSEERGRQGRRASVPRPRLRHSRRLRGDHASGAPATRTARPTPPSPALRARPATLIGSPQARARARPRGAGREGPLRRAVRRLRRPHKSVHQATAARGAPSVPRPAAGPLREAHPGRLAGGQVPARPRGAAAAAVRPGTSEAGPGVARSAASILRPAGARHRVSPPAAPSTTSSSTSRSRWRSCGSRTAASRCTWPTSSFNKIARCARDQRTSEPGRCGPLRTSCSPRRWHRPVSTRPVTTIDWMTSAMWRGIRSAPKPATPAAAPPPPRRARVAPGCRVPRAAHDRRRLLGRAPLLAHWADWPLSDSAFGIRAPLPQRLRRFQSQVLFALLTSRRARARRRSRELPSSPTRVDDDLLLARREPPSRPTAPIVIVHDDALQEARPRSGSGMAACRNVFESYALSPPRWRRRARGVRLAGDPSVALVAAARRRHRS